MLDMLDYIRISVAISLNRNFVLIGGPFSRRTGFQKAIFFK